MALMMYRTTMKASERASAMAAIRFHPFHQVLDQVLEHRGVEFVVDFLTVPLGHDQAGLFQHAQVPRHGWPAGVELGRDLAGGARCTAEKPEDLATGRIGECAKDGVPHLHD